MGKELYRDIALDDFFKELWQSADPFAEVAKIEGEVFREVKNRRTFRIEVDGKGFFVKINLHHIFSIL